MGFVRRRTRRRAMLVAGGLAYEAGKNRGAEEESGYAQAPRQQEVPPAPPPPGPTETAPARPDVGEIEKLAELHSSGALSDEEFAAAKARVLGTDDTSGDDTSQ